MERTDEYVRLCQEESNALGRDGGIPAWTPLSSCLPALIDRSQFQQAATRLHSHIQLAREFVRDNMRDFIQVGRVSQHERAHIESEMLRLLKGCEKGLKQLQEAVKDQKPQRGGPSATQVAHCHGLILVLHVKLKTALESLERIRLVSASTAVSSTPSPVGPSMAAALRSARTQGPFPGSGSPGGISSPPSPPKTTASPPLLASRGPGAYSTNSLKAPHTPPLASTAASGNSQQPQSSIFAFSMKSAKPAVEVQQQEQQQQQQVKLEHVALMEDLSHRYEQVRTIEQQLHQVAQLNRSMAVELTSQMEVAERLYTEALVATNHIDSGNINLRKAAKVKQSSGCTMFGILVCAAAALLVVDYVYPG